jgi:hypothetical protein
VLKCVSVGVYKSIDAIMFACVRLRECVFVVIVVVCVCVCMQAYGLHRCIQTCIQPRIQLCKLKVSCLYIVCN